jgi:hypothetical protein
VAQSVGSAKGFEFPNHHVQQESQYAMSNANTNTATSSTAAADVAKTFVAFFTRENTKGPKIDIFKSLSTKARAPLYSGKIGKKQVSFFLRKGPKGNFLGLAGDKIEGSNQNEDLGTANVVTLGSGIPVLVIDYKNADGTKTPIFASISKKVDNEALVAIGLNVAKQAQKVAATTAAASAPKAEKAAAPKA